MVTDCATLSPNEYPARVHVRAHEFRSDVGTSLGGGDSAPGPHDLFDAALATCKVMTAMWYAKKNGIPLERVESRVESDASEERNGKYTIRVELTYHGDGLDDDMRRRLAAAVAKCPIHKLMTTSEVVVETK